jgi:hypothetical protein
VYSKALVTAGHDQRAAQMPLDARWTCSPFPFGWRTRTPDAADSARCGNREGEGSSFSPDRAWRGLTGSGSASAIASRPRPPSQRRWYGMSKTGGGGAWLRGPATGIGTVTGMDLGMGLARARGGCEGPATGEAKRWVARWARTETRGINEAAKGQVRMSAHCSRHQQKGVNARYRSS